MNDVTTVTTIAETSMTSATTTTENLTIGVSSVDTILLHNDIEITNYLLALIIIMLIGGWIYHYFRDLFNQC